MSRVGATVLILAVGPLVCVISPLSLAGQTPQQSTRQSAPLSPSSPDMPLPDPATFPKYDDKTKSPAKRVIDRLSPLCVDAVFHTCLLWGDSTVPQMREAEREFAKNFDVGNIYFKAKNYKGAESRFREALEYKPDDPDAMYLLARSIDKLGRTREAREVYESYLKLSPRGPGAERARKALLALDKSGTAPRRDAK
jgi:tetratricopeptide (TPR) repeat protein